MEITATTSKSQLAKLLATENITFRHDPSAKTAYFNVRDRMLVLPVWRNISNDLYDMLVVHEVGHALDTPSEKWTSAIKQIVLNVFGTAKPVAEPAVKGYLNVVEDARIDKRQKRRYPGSRRNYIVGYKELIERDFFGTSKLDVQSLTFIDRANIYFKGGFALGLKFSPEERVFLKRMEETETFADVAVLTEEIYRWAKARGEFQRKVQEEEHTFGDSDGDEDGDEYETMNSDGADGDDGDDGSDGDGDDDDGEEGDDEATGSKTGQRGEGDIDEQSETGSKAKSNGAGSSGPDTGDFIPESMTEKAWEENQENIVVNDDVTYTYVTVPKANLKNIVDDYKVVLPQMYKALSGYRTKDWIAVATDKVNKFKAQENAAISFMVKEFEMKKQAEAYAKTTITKTGVLDTNKLHSYRYNEDIFRRSSVVQNGKNHGFVYILDWSGSMSCNIEKTVKQLITMVLFCKRVQIPFEVYTFRDLNSYEANDLYKNPNSQFETGTNKIMFGAFKLRNVLSSRMSLTELNQAFVCLMSASSLYHTEPMGGTPLNQALVAIEDIVKDFRKRNRLEIVNTVILTDGDSNNISGYGKALSSYSEPRRKAQKFFIQDEVTKKEYAINGSLMSAYDQVTFVLLQMLRDRTGSNVIGMYLSTDSLNFINSRWFSAADGSVQNKVKDFWRKNKFVPVSTAGYDEYFVINARDMDIKTDQIAVDASMKKTAVAKEFMRYSERKATNRVLLSRVVDRITTNAKVKKMI